MVECAGLENRLAIPTSDEPADSYDSNPESLAHFLARLESESPELLELLRIWPTLPDAMRNGIIAMVKAVRP